MIICKNIEYLILIASLTLVFSASAATAGNVAAGGVPSAFLPEQVHTFQTVLEGTDVVHDFVLQNKGSEPLIIEKLKSG